MFDPSVLVTAFTSVWNGDPFLPAYCPGGLHYRRFRGESIIRPYATIDVAPTIKQGDTSLHSVQESVVTIHATIDDLVGNVTKVTNAMHDAFDYCQKSLSIAGGHAIHVLPVVPEDMGISPEEKNGRNVNEATAAWSVAIYAN